jgi:methyl-accepting chemotaxis protein
MIAGNAHNFLSATYSNANQPAIKKYLLSNGKDSVEQTIKLLEKLAIDTLFVQVELKDSKGTTLINSAGHHAHFNINIDSLVTSLAGKNDSGRVEKLFAQGHSIYYPIIANIIEDKQLIGYLVRWRRIVWTSRALEQLSQLMGTNARIFLGNVDGSLWTDLLKPVSSPPINDLKVNKIIEYTSSEKNSVIASVCPVKNSKWLIAVELSRKKVFETANRFLYWLIVAGCGLLAIGFFIAWLTSQNISQPIKNLAMANSLLAAGNYSSILDLNRKDEFPRLVREFHAMAIQVQHSREELEKKGPKL